MWRRTTPGAKLQAARPLNVIDAGFSNRLHLGILYMIATSYDTILTRTSASNKERI